MSWCMQFCYEYLCYIQMPNIRNYKMQGTAYLVMKLIKITKIVVFILFCCTTVAEISPEVLCF
jgi:hypothetical protein